MAKKDDMVNLSGRITEVLPNTTYRVELEIGTTITAYMGGKLRKNRIKVLLGDNVEVEMSPYDLTKGRIIYRK